MSFSSDVKEELSKTVPKARHCQLAELSAIIGMCGEIKIQKNGKFVFKIVTENITVARKCFTLLEKTYNIRDEISTQVNIRKNKTTGSKVYVLYAMGNGLQAVLHADVQVVCCKRAFLRGAFLVSGSMSDPNKGYHFEIVCGMENEALYLQQLMKVFGLEAKIVKRKNSYVVYLKEGEQISDVLNVMEAHVALMEFENIRVYKEVRNSVNRQVNCETANLHKTVSASVKQQRDIELIRETIGLEKIPDALREIAQIRLQYPNTPLKEIGNLLNPPIGKSGVNHRFRKLSEIAEKLRENQEEHYD